MAKKTTIKLTESEAATLLAALRVRELLIDSRLMNDPFPWVQYLECSPVKGRDLNPLKRQLIEVAASSL